MTKDLAERLREIRERAEKATPGPWCAYLDANYGEVKQAINPWRNIAIAATVYPEGAWGLAIEDAAFIAHAREDIPWLLDRLSELEQVASDGAVVTANITVNGNAHLIEGRTISYEQVAILAGRPDCKELTMTYDGKGQFSGLLDPGESIPLRDETHFCAVVTGNA